MAIRIQQAGLPELYAKAATLAGQAQRARELEQQAIRRQEQIQSIQAQRESQQIALEQQRNMRLLDAQLDLEMYERSKRWEIDKMQLRSQVDFQREEQQRQRKLDSIDSALQQIDKEVLAGRMTEQEAYPIKLKYEIEKMGVDVPVSLVRPPAERAEKVVSPTQRISAMRALREEEYREPTWLEKFLPGGKGELSPEIQEEKQILQSIVKGEYTAPTGTISSGLPEPKTKVEYDRIPSGSQYIDSEGNVRIKR